MLHVYRGGSTATAPVTLACLSALNKRVTCSASTATSTTIVIGVIGIIGAIIIGTATWCDGGIGVVEWVVLLLLGG